ncbi:unnamed protein product [Rotaria sp. Silwood2]|nr:unnamed protein product [Rotaria sp. Silwood2]CAF2619924.1 unnamed protein product [Rotaria sp. Silwood2]CAF3014855.1 unnamed protein product [Rotaria sp. Silwood2]CAF4003889.1 unnamed protein product [Rotaria sp. Silwood2]CAF4158561.1 unnamed protein product [Rotaria sp. Silwood2]
MSALFSHNYNNFYFQNYFASPKQKKKHYYDREFLRQQSLFPSLYPFGGFPTTYYHQFDCSNMNTEPIRNINQPNGQYRYKQYMSDTGTIQNSYWQQQVNTAPLPMYTRSLPFDCINNTLYPYEKGTQFKPYTTHFGVDTKNLGATGNLDSGYSTRLAYGAGSNSYFSNTSGNIDLTPKIRVIFMPTASLSFQQSYAGPLCMPPFLFNRMSRPFCSLPLPPPLPDISSLPVAPAIQQMVTQQYANPIAVIPFTPNWQLSQPMMSNYSQLQDMQKQPMMSMPNLQSFQFVVQPYITPTLRSGGIPLLPTDSSTLPRFSNLISSIPQYSTSNYFSICRACPPGPPLLNIPVTDHHWIHHCSACHRVPADSTKPNIRPTNGRITSLLRRPMVLQNVDSPRIQRQQQKYPHINASVTMRPWLHNMPLLSPDTVINSDKSFRKSRLSQAFYYSQNYTIQPSRVARATRRSVTVTTISDNRSQTNKDSSKKQQQQHKSNIDNNTTQLQDNSNDSQTTSYLSASDTKGSSASDTKGSSASLTQSLCNSSTASDYEKSDTTSCKTQQSVSQKKLSVEAHNASHFYDFQPCDLLAVYHSIGHIKSDDEDSISLSNSSVSSNVSIHEEYNQNNPPSPTNFQVMKQEEEESKQEEEKSLNALSPIPFQFEEPTDRTTSLREFLTKSPSTISSASFDTVFSIIDDDLDSFSITSTTKDDTYEENEAV